MSGRRPQRPRWDGGAARGAASALVLAACTPDAAAPTDLGTTLPPSRVVRLEPLEPLPPPPREPVIIDPEAEETLRRNLSREPVPLAETSAPKVTRIALEHTARSEARGLEAEPVRTAVVPEGGRGSAALPLETGDCVTVIAHGGIGVSEVDVFVVDRTGDRLMLLGQDARNGPLGIVGGQRGCLVHLGPPLPHAEVWVQARVGTGPVVVGVYRALKP